MTGTARRRAPVDLVVVGLGIMGSSAAWAAATAGAAVFGADAHPLGHTLGSSHGDSRLIRRAYPGTAYSDMLDLAYEGWTEAEVVARRSLVHRVGGIFINQGTGLKIGEHQDWLDGAGCTIGWAREIGGDPFDADDDAVVVRDPDAGVLRAAECLATLRELAARSGAELVHGLAVEGWTSDGPHRIQVRLSDGSRLSATALVLTAGPWVTRLLPETAGHLHVERIVNAYVTPPETPAFKDLTTFTLNLPEAVYYGMPVAERGLIKIGRDDGEVVPPDALDQANAPPTSQELSELASVLRRFLPGSGRAVDGLTCRYTVGPNRRFILCRAQRESGVVVGTGFSGHGFKFGPAVGRVLVDLALGRTPQIDVAPFAGP